MMKKKSLKLVAAGLMMMMATAFVAGCGTQDKVGFVDSYRVMKESTKGKDVTQKMNAKETEIRAKLDAAKAQESDEQFKQTMANADRELQVYGSAMQKDLQTYMEQNIGSLAKEEGVTVVVEKAAIGGGGVDLTDKLLEKIGTADPENENTNATSQTQAAPATAGAQQ